jgi:hypothetical protein
MGKLADPLEWENMKGGDVTGFVSQLHHSCLDKLDLVALPL